MVPCFWAASCVSNVLSPLNFSRFMYPCASGFPQRAVDNLQSPASRKRYAKERRGTHLSPCRPRLPGARGARSPGRGGRRRGGLQAPRQRVCRGAMEARHVQRPAGERVATHATAASPEVFFMQTTHTVPSAWAWRHAMRWRVVL
jgi:hypothetical protein